MTQDVPTKVAPPNAMSDEPRLEPQLAAGVEL